MTEDTRLVDGPCLPCLILDAVFSKTKRVDCVYSGAALWGRAADHDRGGKASREGMPNIGCGVSKKTEGSPKESQWKKQVLDLEMIVT